MVEQGNRKAFSTFSSLQRFAQEESKGAAKEAAEAAQEHCDLCGEPIPSEHRHLLEVSTREIMCACRPCSILFDSEAASEGRYRLIPDRHLFLEDFEMSDAQWESLRIPVDMAFFFHSTPAERVVAFYPSPMGPTEALQDRRERELRFRPPIRVRPGPRGQEEAADGGHKGRETGHDPGFIRAHAGGSPGQCAR